jgi:Ni,Fe-hydrogenase I cytochrome b subunit
MKNKRAYRLAHWIIMLALAICVSIVVYVSRNSPTPSSDNEQTLNLDSLREVHRNLYYRLREDSLKTLEDSVHEFEDGF